MLKTEAAVSPALPSQYTYLFSNGSETMLRERRPLFGEANVITLTPSKARELAAKAVAESPLAEINHSQDFLTEVELAPALRRQDVSSVEDEATKCTIGNTGRALQGLICSVYVKKLTLTSSTMAKTLLSQREDFVVAGISPDTTSVPMSWQERRKKYMWFHFLLMKDLDSCGVMYQ
ncbi:hypothetical protein HPB51_020356 [Rhipicephalus microplus]|uniref:Uncharacterized protein n=1 Tax=Rhipicephalus microplus TaxID=6941 RepID=A0A9J6DWB6_RHIMP|nr:hypothetical protein HPB51_020356 [Rhipicephalus microplus]